MSQFTCEWSRSAEQPCPHSMRNLSSFQDIDPHALGHLLPPSWVKLSHFYVQKGMTNVLHFRLGVESTNSAFFFFYKKIVNGHTHSQEWSIVYHGDHHMPSLNSISVAGGLDGFQWTMDKYSPYHPHLLDFVGIIWNNLKIWFTIPF